jgi:hypothetical protein
VLLVDILRTPNPEARRFGARKYDSDLLQNHHARRAALTGVWKVKGRNARFNGLNQAFLHLGRHRALEAEIRRRVRQTGDRPRIGTELHV